MTGPRDRTAHASDRRHRVTDEPFRIDPEVIGTPLATVTRRAIAMAVDLTVVALLAIPLGIVTLAAAMWLQTPELFAASVDVLRGEAESVDIQASDVEVFELVRQRRPEILPADLAEALESRDPEAVRRVRRDLGIDLDIRLGESTPSYYDPGTDTLHLRGDVILGPAQRFGTLLGWMLIYFTLTGIHGRTPGKWLLGIRARRLDGGPMGIWQAFQRAGSYSASLSTLGMGFLQAIRDPNRQALHDRVCATVVVREPRDSRRT